MDDLVDEVTVSGFVRSGQVWSEAGIHEELLGGSSQHETAQPIGGFRIALMRDPLSRAVEFVDPEQLVGEGEGVALEVELTRLRNGCGGSGGVGFGTDAAGEGYGEQDEERKRGDEKPKAEIRNPKEIRRPKSEGEHLRARPRLLLTSARQARERKMVVWESRMRPRRRRR